MTVGRSRTVPCLQLEAQALSVSGGWLSASILLDHLGARAGIGVESMLSALLLLLGGNLTFSVSQNVDTMHSAAVNKIFIVHYQTVLWGHLFRPDFLRFPWLGDVVAGAFLFVLCLPVGVSSLTSAMISFWVIIVWKSQEVESRLAPSAATRFTSRSDR